MDNLNNPQREEAQTLYRKEAYSQRNETLEEIRQDNEN